jgi:Flp pilus assembly protein TadB
MTQRNDEERTNARARSARQVLSGSEVRPPSTQSSFYATSQGLFSSSQRTYLIAAGGLLVFGGLLWVLFGFSVASVIFFLLALTLIAGWLVF